uniref:Carboxypeptidase n=1 Tax=Euplotes crassus TaxID=5936 RepID=A0A7S3K994_EUPCR|mmetsp:Transcript_13799/g.13750  ORF Transcript_13799/g.13750 Transcript_13799/m.13750 type:complete len:467 (+) Transcript_13799:14-1414(+)
MKIFTPILALIFVVGLANAAFADDLVTEMPDCPKFDFDMYSGYLDVNANKSLHYVLVESLGDPANDPILMWFNGGPGCSSMLGFMQENGPCIIDDGENFVKENPFPWNEKANVLYLEAPAGVGYSFARNKEDMESNDLQSSHENLQALKQFYKKFPEYQENDLFISGESYAGIYVPNLAYRIHQHNTMSKINKRTPINLKGILVGNGATKWEYDTTPSYLEMAYNHQLMDTELHNTFVENGCEWYFRDVLPRKANEACEKAKKTFDENTKRINWYDIYRKVYDDGGINKERVGKTIIDGEERYYPRGYKMTDYTPWLEDIYGESAPILGDYVSDYLNRPDVRDAFHIKKEIHTYKACAGGDLTYHLQKEGSHWIYHILKSNGIRILKFSGDTDGAVPTYGSQLWIRDLGWDVVKDWHAWLVDDQVAGYQKEYDGLTFATVHGVGHMAPQWKRKEVTQLITDFIHAE